MLLRLCIKTKRIRICQDAKGFFFLQKSQFQISTFRLWCTHSASVYAARGSGSLQKGFNTGLKVPAAQWGFPAYSWGGWMGLASSFQTLHQRVNQQWAVFKVLGRAQIGLGSSCVSRSVRYPGGASNDCSQLVSPFLLFSFYPERLRAELLQKGGSGSRNNSTGSLVSSNKRFQSL